MAKAPIEIKITIPGYEDVEAGIVKWPLSVIRIRHKDEKRLIDLADHILRYWQETIQMKMHSSMRIQMESHTIPLPRLQEKRDGLF